MMFIDILSFFFWPVVIIGVIVFFIVRKVRKNNAQIDKERYLQIAISKEDMVSQVFLLLGVCFLGVTLLSFNQDLGNPLSSITILIITSIISLIGAYYFKALYLLAIGLIGVLGWWAGQSTDWISDKSITEYPLFLGMVFIALLFYSIGHLHEKDLKWKRFSLIYLFLGIASVTSALFIFSTMSGIKTLENVTTGASFFGSWEITLSLFVLLLSLCGVLIYTVSKKLMTILEMVAVLLVAFLFGIIAILPAQDTYFFSSSIHGFYANYELSPIGIAWSIIFNIAIFLHLLGLIFYGYMRREAWLINIGAFFLFILIIVKYFDWFFTFLDKSIFFIGAGILLFLVGWFMEKGRRGMIASIKLEEQKIQQ